MDERQNLIDRARIVRAMLMAVENAPRLLEVCATADADDHAELVAAVADEFDIDSLEADVILNMRVRRFTPRDVAQLRSELDLFEQRIRELGRA
ncbi:hypothetical protein [Microbacterium sp. NPDC096154]|uniref:hypothetical protein n=1 Tax=Microbacterium sp. NPDC096154 TaxID=3155549 RepID=UPI0033238E37